MQTEKVVSTQLQKRVSILYIVIGIITILLNTYVGFQKEFSIIEILTSPNFYPILVFVIIFSLTLGRQNRIIQFLHVLPLFLYSSLAIWERYNSFYGLNLFIIAVVLLFKYGFFKRFFIPKIIFFVLYIIVLIELSLRNTAYGEQVKSMSVLIFLCFYIFFIGLIFKDEIMMLLHKERLLTSEISTLKLKEEELTKEMERLAGELDKNKEKMDVFYKKYVDLSKFNLTKREYSILEKLCADNCTNKELAYDFNISLPSVKQHLNNIYSKLNIRRRSDVVEACKPYFVSLKVDP